MPSLGHTMTNAGAEAHPYDDLRKFKGNPGWRWTDCANGTNFGGGGLFLRVCLAQKVLNAINGASFITLFHSTKVAMRDSLHHIRSDSAFRLRLLGSRDHALTFTPPFP